eukprot:CCRYP_001455-RA/>CCRYP_001455-RA protein AED:0.41 eAED:0.41 QI:43/1/1/1/0/0/3/15/73
MELKASERGRTNKPMRTVFRNIIIGHLSQWPSKAIALVLAMIYLRMEEVIGWHACSAGGANWAKEGSPLSLSF